MQSFAVCIRVGLDNLLHSVHSFGLNFLDSKLIVKTKTYSIGLISNVLSKI